MRDALELRPGNMDGSHIGDAPVLPELLSQIPADEEIESGEPGER